MQETPFCKLHQANGARMVDFAGWNMPVQYHSIVAEHRMVRSTVGIFDVSHMGRIMIGGPDHIRFTDHVCTNARAGMRPGQVRYNLICNDKGYILDDILVSASLKEGAATAADLERNPAAALSDGGTMIVCNAGNHPKIAGWLREQAKSFKVALLDATPRLAMLALQGPKSADALKPLTDVKLSAIKYYHFAIGTVCGIADTIISRTGYTGEDGFELIFDAKAADMVFGALLKNCTAQGGGLAGLGARDTLRLEAGMPLYGHEIDETVNPVEAGLDWAVRLDKEFVGKDVLAKVKAENPARLLTGIEVDSKRTPRQGHTVFAGGRPVGKVASGAKSPTQERMIATALVPRALAEPGTALEVEVKEGLREPAKAVALPFYKRAK